LYDVSRLRWDEQLCSLFEVPMRALAEVRESFDQFGTTSANGALPSELCIRGVMGDSQASLFAQGCYQPGSAKATFGSGTSVLVNTGERFETSARGSVAALAWVWKGRPTFAIEGIINYSSATIAWLRDQLGLIDDAGETAAMALSVEDNGGVYFVPAFGGLSAPYWSPHARAAIVGMTAQATKEHIVRAALEAIAYQIRDALESLSVDGRALQSLCVDGRPTSNEFLMQFTADLTRAELVVADVPESSTRGVALAAMLGHGIIGSLEELASIPRDVRRYRPKMDAGLAEQLFAGWKAAVNRVL
jgi:glycerol kinase